MQQNGTSARSPPRLAAAHENIEAIGFKCIGNIKHQTLFLKGNDNENLIRK